MAKAVFKDYNPDQPTFLPEKLEDFIGENHQARFISSLIDRMDISEIIDTYKGGGTSSYHPRMMLKVLIYAYVQRVHSSRQIAKAVRENVTYMWLAGKQKPDFRTINNFRKDRLPEGGAGAIFRQVMLMLIGQGLVDLQDYTVEWDHPPRPMPALVAPYGPKIASGIAGRPSRVLTSILSRSSVNNLVGQF